MARPKKNSSEEVTSLGQELLEAAHLMVAHATGKPGTEHFKTTTYQVPDKVDVYTIRQELHMTQEQLAALMGVTPHAIRHWENERRQPEGPARVLLHMLHNNPRAVIEAMGCPAASFLTS